MVLLEWETSAWATLGGPSGDASLHSLLLDVGACILSTSAYSDIVETCTGNLLLH